MKLYFSEKIRILADKLQKPLYAVGGYTRNFLIDKSLSKDIDLSAPVLVEDLKPLLSQIGFTVLCEYKHTCTIVFRDDEGRYEFTSFRSEIYDDGGEHTPKKVEFTEDIYLDAIRRDFKCNAVYYDIKNDKFIDLLGGIDDIEKKRLSTVVDANEVFSHDGLRLLRLARFSGELDFTVDNDTLIGAKLNAKNILDISKERIYDELKKILICDKKYPFSNKVGHYKALKLLDKIGVLDFLFCDLAKGRGLQQRSDFHNYDVLEHSLRTCLYADESIRLPALLHDIGKPYAMEKDGKYAKHNVYGEKIVQVVLQKLKVDKKTIRETAFLTLNHMVDLKCDMGKNKVKWFIVNNRQYFDKLLLLKQADFSACKDDLSISPSVIRWQNIYSEMVKEKIPFSTKDLNITASEIVKFGVLSKDVGKTLNALLKKVIFGEVPNIREKLLKILPSVKI